MILKPVTGHHHQSRQAKRAGLLLSALLGLVLLGTWMNLAPLSEVRRCEQLLLAQLDEPQSYFRSGYRYSASGWAPGIRRLYVSFTRPRHGLATCMVEARRNGEITLSRLEFAGEEQPLRSLP